MNIEVHYGGYFDFLGNRKQYIGGKVSEISDFDSDKMSWFELRFMLKDLGLVSNYLVFQLLHGHSLETGLVEINSDKTVLDIISCLSLERNILLYIINMPSEMVQNELLPDYCLEDPSTKETNVKTTDKGKSIMVDESGVGDIVSEDDEIENIRFEGSEDNADSVYFYNPEGDVDEVDSERNGDGDSGKSGDVVGGGECDPRDDIESVYLNSDSLHTPTNSDDDCVSSKYPIFRTRDLDHPTLEIGMEFESAAQIRELLRQYAIKESFDLCWSKNEGDKIIVKCKALGCQFRVYAACNTSTCRFQIRTLIPKHSCTRALTNSQITSSWLAKKYLEQFRSDPNMNWKVFRSTVQRELGVTVSKSACYRSRQKALEEVQGKFLEQFKKIRQYAQAILESNPGSYAIVKTREIGGNDHSVAFEAVFISYSACLQGLVNGCRPIIGMDGCHLSSIAGGILLSAVARDPNNQMFPIAFAVVEVENKQSWSWFINNLVEAVGVEHVQGLTFITDRQKGLVESLKLLVPNADIRFCVRHLYANFKEKFKGLILKRLLWQAAASYSKEDHDEAMKEMQIVNLEAFNYLNAIEKHLWSRSHFKTITRCDLLCNNISEAFNKYILDARDKPIITMLEMIRRQLMTRLQMTRDQIKKCQSLICPRITSKLNEISMKSRECLVYFAGGNNFEVKEKGRHCCVNLHDRVCDCNEWMLTGIPCRHAMAAIRYIRGDPLLYTHECYSTSKYIAAYEGIIFPIPDSSKWKEQEGFEILPPKARRQPGRPPKNRKKAPDELRDKLAVSKVGQVIRCSQCKQVGHNKRRCNTSNQQAATNVHQPTRSIESTPMIVRGRNEAQGQQPTSNQQGRVKIPVVRKNRRIF